MHVTLAVFLGFFVLCTPACNSGDAGAAPSDPDASCSTCADASDESASDAADPDAPPACGTSSWPTYGHDARRTFATDGCIRGPLEVSWTYVPTAPAGKMVKAMTHVVARPDAVFLQWAATADAYVGTTALDRVGATGARVWTYDTGSDANLGNWASLTTSAVVLNDDGVYFVDNTSGKVVGTTGVDWWGQTIPNGAGVWFVTTSKSDGPGLFVGLMDSMAKVTWKQNEQGTHCGDGFADTVGGIALDAGTLFYAANYNAGTAGKPLLFASGVYAFDATTGTPKWKVATTPTSVISAGAGHVYLVESGMTLMARSQADGSKAWSADLPGAGAQAPVLSGGLVIVGTAAGVSAFDEKSGAPAWTATLTGAQAMSYALTITNGCAGTQNQGAAIATTIAVAEASKTVVVTAADGVHLLDLATGSELWKGPVAGAMGSLHDPVIVGDVLYVLDSPPNPIGGFGAGRLYALKKK